MNWCLCVGVTLKPDCLYPSPSVEMYQLCDLSVPVSIYIYSNVNTPQCLSRKVVVRIKYVHTCKSGNKCSITVNYYYFVWNTECFIVLKAHSLCYFIQCVAITVVPWDQVNSKDTAEEGLHLHPVSWALPTCPPSLLWLKNQDLCLINKTVGIQPKETL